MQPSEQGEICGWHYVTHKSVRVSWAAGWITHVDPCATDLAKVWLAPALLDLQVNGFAGVDFQQDNLTAAQLLQAARGLRTAACARFFLTLITDDWTTMLERLRHVRELRAASTELQSSIAGWHIEGPFLSTEPGYHGAHDPARMFNAAASHIAQLREIAGSDPVLLTLSPERAGAMQAIATAVASGIKVNLGHTNAPAEVLQQAVKAGATGFTHLANGCPRELDRHDNIILRVLETPGLTVNLIPDGTHVSPPLFRLIHRALGNDAIYYSSDAMAAGGAPPGKYKLGKLEVEVGADQVVRQPGKALFAGSALRPVEGVFRAAEMLRSSWQESWKRFSEIPARLAGLRAGLTVGDPSHLCALTFSEDRKLLECHAL
jgi:N-acetylglucosamine-6-phosphate deacetylase